MALPPIPNAAGEIAEACWTGPIAMAICEENGCIVSVNEEFDELLGYGPSALNGKHFREFTVPSDAASDEKEFNRLMSGEIDHYSMVKSWITKQGLIVAGKMHVSRTNTGDVLYAIAQINHLMSEEQMITIATIAQNTIREEIGDRLLCASDAAGVRTRSSGQVVYDFLRDQWGPICVSSYILFQLGKLVFESQP